MLITLSLHTEEYCFGLQTISAWGGKAIHTLFGCYLARYAIIHNDKLYWNAGEDDDVLRKDKLWLYKAANELMKGLACNVKYPSL